MALVERIMHYTSEPQSRWISVHLWYAVMGQLCRGEITRQNVIDYFSMTVDDIADLDALIARYQTKSTQGDRALFVSAVHEIFLMAEHRVSGYDDPANIRTRIGRI